MEILFEGLEGVLRSVAIVAEGLADFEGPIEESLVILSGGVVENVAVTGRPPYPDILPDSRAHRKFSQGPALFDSGEMLDAATALEPAEHSLYALTPMDGQIGVDPLFHGARRHQFGYGGPDSIGRTFSEPARAFMVFNEGERAQVVEVFDRYLHSLVMSRK